MQLRYVPLPEALDLVWVNPKGHAIEALKDSILRYGFRDPSQFDQTLGKLVRGNGRIIALGELFSEGRGVPEGIKVVDGVWQVPVVEGIAFDTVDQARSYGIDDNGLTVPVMLDLDPVAIYDQDMLASIVGELVDSDQVPVTMTDEIVDRLLDGPLENAPKREPSDNANAFFEECDDDESEIVSVGPITFQITRFDYLKWIEQTGGEYPEQKVMSLLGLEKME